jgi:hypothetical protein
MVQPKAVERPTAKWMPAAQHRGVILAHVLDGVGLAHGKGDAHGVDTRLGGTCSSLGVRHQRDHVQPLDCSGEGDQLGGVGHLRQEARGHEAADFDFPHARCRLGCNPALLGFERHDPADRLQPVARSDFGNENVGHVAVSR